MRSLGIFIAVWLGFSAVLGLSLSVLLDDHASDAPGVIRVDERVFTTTDFDTARRVALNGESAPDAPAYTRCIAQQRQQLNAAKQKVPSQAEMLKQCQAADQQINEQAAAMLIQGAWLTLDAARLKVSVTDTEVAEAFAQQRQQSFPAQADFDTYLERSGLTIADIKEQVRLNVISGKLQQHYLRGKLPKITDRDLRAVYQQQKKQMPKGSTFAKVKEQIRQQIQQQKTGSVLERAFGQIQDRYRPLTECLGDVKVVLCHNVDGDTSGSAAEATDSHDR